MRRMVPNLVVALILLTSARAANAAWQFGLIEMEDNFRSPPQVMRARLWPLGDKGALVRIRMNSMHAMGLSAAPAATRGYVVVSAEKGFEFSDSTATRQTAEGARVYRTGVWGSARMVGIDDAEFIVHFIAFSGRGAPKDSAELVALWNKYEGQRK